MMTPRMTKRRTGSPASPDLASLESKKLIFAVLLAGSLSLPGLTVQAEDQVREGSGPEQSAASDLDSDSDADVKKAKPALPASEAEQKKYFKTWFEAFYGKLYYAKDPVDVMPYYTAHCRRSMAKQTGITRKQTLAKLRGTYIGRPKIAKVISHPGGRSLDVKVSGNISVNQRNGFGYCIYRMINEGGVWKIDSAAARGQFTGSASRHW